MKKNLTILFVTAALILASYNYLVPRAFSALMDQYLAKDINVEKIYQRVRQVRSVNPQGPVSAQGAESKEKADIAVDNSPVRGNASAPSTLVGFFDFACPMCGRAAKTLKELVEKHPDKVKLVFKHMALPGHSKAQPASLATIAAGKQNKFWEMHDYIFQHQKELGNELYLAGAVELGLDVEKFKQDLANQSTVDLFMKDQTLAESLSIRGTPTFYFNGNLLQGGAMPLYYFESLVTSPPK